MPAGNRTGIVESLYNDFSSSLRIFYELALPEYDATCWGYPKIV